MLGDPDQTLSYMLGDDRDTIPLLGDDSLSDADLDDISMFLDADLADPDLEGNTGSETLKRPHLPPVQTTRAGRKTKLPARYLD